MAGSGMTPPHEFIAHKTGKCDTCGLAQYDVLHVIGSLYKKHPPDACHGDDCPVCLFIVTGGGEVDEETA